MKKLILTTCVLMFAVAISNAQSIPNAGFENWSNPNGYNIPDNWGNLNDMTSMANIYTCTKGTPGNPGASYLKLVSKNVTGMGIMPGIAVSGVLDENSLAPVSGFAFNQRPTALTGKWQFMGNSPDDNGYIRVYFTKWDTGMNMRDTIGYTTQNLNGMQMSWANFSFPISYNSTDFPDSCIIILNASGANPEANSYLYVDNLDFTGLVTSVENIEVTDFFKVYPNPSSEILVVDLSGLKSSVINYEIIDIHGKVVWLKNANETLLQNISISQLPPGNYSLKIQTQKSIVTQKFVKK